MKRILITMLFIALHLRITPAPHPDPSVIYDLLHQANGSSLPVMQDTAIQIRPFQLEIVAPSSGIQFYRNGILFLSYSKALGKMTEKHLSFGTLRPFVAAVYDSVPGEYIPFLTGSSVIFPTEGTSFSRDNNTMYVSMIPDKKSREKIFGASCIQNQWIIDDSPLSFCKENNTYTHPALSQNGEFMIFSSDMEGSAGGLDLFLTKKENEKWSEPVNLGVLINTSGNEMFASLDNENNLYFSSDGLPGLGGYDIFMCRYDGKNWSKPENLTSVINSPNDEVAFTINPVDARSAFFTLRAREARSNAQLFRVTLKSELSSGQGSSLPLTFIALTGLSKESQPSAFTAMTSTNSANSQPKTVEPVRVAGVSKETRVEPKMETKPEPVTATKLEPKVQPEAESKNIQKVIPKQTSGADAKKTTITYRVQILANTKPVGSYDLTIAGKVYKTFEYLYAGGYRTTAGEFSSLAEAVNFQNTCRKSGYDQAFVVAFRDNIRTNDPELFKK